MKFPSSFLCNLVFAGLALSLMNGCSKDTKPNDIGNQEDTPNPIETESSETQAFPGSNANISLLEDIEDALATRVIYFEYDRSEISLAQREVVEAHGKFLASRPDTRVVLESHADERGSREYNLALGEQRGIAVKNQLVLLGALDSQIKVVSYGEERPAVEGNDKDAWQQNRRVEIFY
ncbi:MAG: peptidoglycan-associated lipoprotein Pal [Candidatus Eutrophobiaceae bacterium]